LSEALAVERVLHAPGAGRPDLLINLQGLPQVCRSFSWVSVKKAAAYSFQGPCLFARCAKLAGDGERLSQPYPNQRLLGRELCAFGAIEWPGMSRIWPAASNKSSVHRSIVSRYRMTGVSRRSVRGEKEQPGPAGEDVAGDPRWSRRRVLAVGLGAAAAVVAAGGSGVELVSQGVLPGKNLLDKLDGACSVPSPPLAFSPLGPSFSSTLHSRARNRTVGYTIAYPPAHRVGDELPLVVMLHGYGANHTSALAGITPAQAVALKVHGRPLAAMAMVTVDGGGGYWNPHPGDDPMAMVIEELIPLCQRAGLGRGPQRIGTMGISMGGYGALLLAEKYPHLIAAVAVISPAIWTSYAQAKSANAGAYASAADFATNDAVTHTSSLARIPVRVASGYDDSFYPGVQALARVLPAGAVVAFGKGCHTGPFFTEQQPPSLAFLARHLVS
jgi:enterochelin esterase-like enzyme